MDKNTGKIYAKSPDFNLTKHEVSMKDEFGKVHKSSVDEVALMLTMD